MTGRDWTMAIWCACFTVIVMSTIVSLAKAPPPHDWTLIYLLVGTAVIGGFKAGRRP